MTWTERSGMRPKKWHIPGREAIQASTITDKVLTKEDFMRVMGKLDGRADRGTVPGAFESGTEPALEDCCKVENAYLRGKGSETVSGH